jgi:hypothetical protein
MTRATRGDEYTGANLYVAFELGIDEWKLAFTTYLGAKARLRVMPARVLRRLKHEIAGAKEWYGVNAGAPVRSCYEAGRDGFWLHRYLTAQAIDNRVVDSSSIEVNRRLRRAKSDRLDAGKLLGMLVRYHAGEAKVWSVVRVPMVEDEDRRQLHRELRTLKKERTRVTNRVKGLLANQGSDCGRALTSTPPWRGCGSGTARRCRRGCGPGCSGRGTTRSSCTRRSSSSSGSASRRLRTGAARRSRRSGSCSACERSDRAGRGCT